MKTNRPSPYWSFKEILAQVPATDYSFTGLPLRELWMVQSSCLPSVANGATPCTNIHRMFVFAKLQGTFQAGFFLPIPPLLIFATPSQKSRWTLLSWSGVVAERSCLALSFNLTSGCSWASSMDSTPSIKPPTLHQTQLLWCVRHLTGFCITLPFFCALLASPFSLIKP